MNPLIRLIPAILITLVFFGLFCIVWIENPLVQLLVLPAVLIVAAFQFGLPGLWKKIITISPVVLLLAFVYLLFGVWGWGQTTEYWVHYGITRTLVLANSLFFMQIVISWLKPEDFLDSSLSIHKLKYLILGQHLYSVSLSAYRELCLFSVFMPTNQLRKRKWKSLFQTRLAVILALIAYVISEATLKGEMIDERIRLCHQRAADTPEPTSQKSDDLHKE